MLQGLPFRNEEGWLLLLPEPTAPGLPAAPLAALVRTRVVSLLLRNLLHAYAHNKLHECTRDKT
jgi:hypothetical protein